ncbi:hypothetical protein [Okeania sp.]|uniref:hypothetical protein n=1 Tax=Okeania sp. TaxID=3100323 RepID=UPI002B4B6FCD|nr:hypothetical protein [Okeania sp.]MEB3339521.1 hypothetical protein [Okeania sp.]
MNTILPTQKGITFLTLTFILSMIPKPVMAVTDINHYYTQVDTKNISITFQIAYTPEPGDQGQPEDSQEGGGGR